MFGCPAQDPPEALGMASAWASGCDPACAVLPASRLVTTRKTMLALAAHLRLSGRLLCHLNFTWVTPALLMRYKLVAGTGPV